MVVNPTKVDWTNPSSRVDGTPYDQSQNAGYDIVIDGQAAVAIPATWTTTFDLTTLDAYKALKTGTHTIAMDVVSQEGLHSAFSAADTFRRALPPMAPTNVLVS